MDKRIFVGSNTPIGFHSYYASRLKAVQRIFILKGGPGTGKSTLIRKAGAESARLGLDCEYWYCSGDPSSLDGVYIKKLNTAVVDGTAPHIIDATLPAVKESVVALGDFIDEKKVRAEGGEIAALATEKSVHYLRAYKALSAAKRLKEAEESVEEGLISDDKLTQLATSLAYHVRRAVNVTNQYATAITPAGLVTFNDFMSERQIIALKASSGRLVHRFFGKLKHMLCGYDAFHCPFAPAEIEAMSLARYAIVPFYLAPKEPSEVIELDTALKKTPDTYPFENEEFERVFAHAVSELDSARRCHIEMEKFYIPAMDFDGVSEKTAKVITEIFALVN